MWRKCSLQKPVALFCGGVVCRAWGSPGCAKKGDSKQAGSCDPGQILQIYMDLPWIQMDSLWFPDSEWFSWCKVLVCYCVLVRLSLLVSDVASAGWSQGVPKLGSRPYVKQHLQTYQVDMMYRLKRYVSVHIHKQENRQQAQLHELLTPTIHAWFRVCRLMRTHTHTLLQMPRLARDHQWRVSIFLQINTHHLLSFA